MAKIGEGDERWIVADREDGTNVNSWHWQEKDAEWSRERFADLLGAIEFEDGGVDAGTGVTALTGEAYSAGAREDHLRLRARPQDRVRGHHLGRR